MKKFNFCFSIQQNLDLKIFRLKENIQCYNYASDSFILSIAIFIINNYPKLKPPTISLELYKSAKIGAMQKDYAQSYHPFEQPWSNYIVDLVTKDHALYHDNIYYVHIPLQQISKSMLQSSNLNEFSLKNKFQTEFQRSKTIFKLSNIEKSKNKIGIISYRPLSNNKFEPRINSPALFLGNLYNNESWTVFKVGDNQIPSIDDLVHYNCIIFPGSAYSVLNTPHQTQIVVQNIFTAFKMNPNIKILGACFGHQIIAQYFGSKIQKLNRIGGIQKIRFNNSLIKDYPFFREVWNIPDLSLSQHHQDFVTSLPKGFKKLAESSSCQYQSLISNDERILTCQFHSQYFCQFTKRYQNRSIAFYGMNDLKKFYIAETNERQKVHNEHSRLMLKVYWNFIHN